MTRFCLGDIVRVKGDDRDCTDCIDGMLGVVLRQNDEDVEIAVWHEEEGTYMRWYCWDYNLTGVE